MKRRSMFLPALAAAVLMTAVPTVAGCGKEAESTAQETVQNTEETTETAQNTKEEGVHTVTYYDSDGTTVLKTEETADGETLKEYIPQKEGYTFVGWFGTPQMNHRYVEDTPVTEDISLFAGFVSNVEDTREFAIVGSGSSPVLLASNWGKVIGEEQKLTKEDNSDANVYSITLDLEAGDEFQFATNSDWHNQRGYGYLDTISKDGKDYFANSGGLGETSTKRSNIKCAVAGNYTFTLTTYPGEDTYETDNANYSEENKDAFNINSYDVITWTYNGEGASAGQEKQVDYYIKGEKITGWEDVYSDETKFQEQDGVYVLTVDLTEGDEFMFTSTVTIGDNTSAGTEYIRYTNIQSDDTESLSYVTGTETANLVAGQTGTYTFTYDSSSQELSVAFE